jgi:hypothetical protein
MRDRFHSSPHHQRCADVPDGVLQHAGLDESQHRSYSTFDGDQQSPIHGHTCEQHLLAYQRRSQRTRLSVGRLLLRCQLHIRLDYRKRLGVENEMTHPLPSCKGWVYGCWSSAAARVENALLILSCAPDTRRFMALVWSSAPDGCAMRHWRCRGRWPFLSSTKSVRCLFAEGPFGFPILRAGRIASYPILPTADTKTILLDFPVLPGNSGGRLILPTESVLMQTADLNHRSSFLDMLRLGFLPSSARRPPNS